jgi:hypothetical protein
MKTSLLILTSLLFAFNLEAATVTGRNAKSPLVGTEEFPINDAGVDKKVTAANILYGLTITTTTGTLTIANGKTVTANNTLTFAGTDGTTMTFPSTSQTLVGLTSTATLTNKTLTAPVLSSPIMTTPTLGVATATSVNGLTITTSTGTLTVANGKTLAASNTLTFAGTDGTTMTFPSTSGTVITATSTATLTNKTLTAPVLTTPTLGVATATTVNKITLTAPATGATLTLTDGKTLAVTNSLTLAGTDSTTFTFPATSATVFTSTLSTNNVNAANSVWGASNALVFEGSSADDFETSVTATGPTADRTVTLADASGTVDVNQASTAVALAADNQAVTPGAASRIQLSSNDATPANRTFTLSATGAITGQIYVIIAPASNGCEIADTGIQVLSAAWSPDANDTLTLLFNGTNFIELARSAN